MIFPADMYYLIIRQQPWKQRANSLVDNYGTKTSTDYQNDRLFGREMSILQACQTIAF